MESDIKKNIYVINQAMSLHRGIKTHIPLCHMLIAKVHKSVPIRAV